MTKSTNTNTASFFAVLTVFTVVVTLGTGIVLWPFETVNTNLYAAATALYLAILSAALVFKPGRDSVEAAWDATTTKHAYIDTLAVTVLGLGATLFAGLALPAATALLGLLAFSTLDVTVRGLVIRSREA